MGLVIEFAMAVVAAVTVEVFRTIWDKRLQRPWIKTFLPVLIERVFRKKTLLYVGGFLLLLILSDLTPIRLGETVRVMVLGLPRQEQLVNDALSEFDRGNFQNAIDRSRAVISEYAPAAGREEHQLESQGESTWTEGKVPLGKAWEAMTVFSHGSLNSVALAWWVTGRSQESLGHVCDAKRAYEAATRYARAWTWDPQFWPIRGWSPFGWFWSPPDDARERGQSLTRNEIPN